MEKEYIFALLIDSDNLSINYYDIIISELEMLGVIKYKRVYGNFDKSNPWTNHAIKRGITPIQAFAPVKGKNATDMVMAIDAMDIFYTNSVDAFCIATSDSDFARLAQRLKEGGQYVVIAGKEQSPESLNNSCNKFLMLDRLFDMTNKEKTVDKKNTGVKEVKVNEDENVVSVPKIETIKKSIREIINERAHDDGWAYYAEVVPQLEKKYPQFNYKLYGVKGKQEFFKFNIGCEIKMVKTAAMIRIKD